MSHRKKYKKYQKKYGHGAQVAVPAQDHFLLEVLRRAEKHGAKAGHKTARKALKHAEHNGPNLSEAEVEELYAAAERAGAAAALLAARKVLGKNLGHGELPPESMSTGHAPMATVDPRQVPPAGYVPGATQASERSRGHHLQGMGQHVLTIKRIEELSPEMVRIVAGAPKLAGYRPNSKADQYVKMYYADPALGLVPPYDLKALRQTLPRQQMPRSRSYTIRWVDEAAEELAIDFVLHQDPGSAGAWAAAAKVGDPLVISGARGKFTPRSKSDYFIFAADEAGIPAISSAVAMLPENAQGVALLEIAGPGSEFTIPHPDGVELRWLHRNGEAAGTTDLLPQAMRALPQRSRNTSVMAHAERTAAKAMSGIASGWGLDKKSVHISSYWTLRRAKIRH